MIRAYWFGGDTLPHGDGRKVAIGTTHTVEPPIVPCKRGLHASRHPLDALQYANANKLWLVDCRGEVVEQADKLACSERTYLARIDAEPILRAFARWCALRVAHLWDMPIEVRRYLETGDEAFRDQAERMARDAAWAAAMDAEWAAAMDAARDAAMDAARDAAWDAARDAAWAAARAAARDAARDAARGAAWAAARDAAMDAAMAEQRTEFQQLIDEAFAKEVKP